MTILSSEMTVISPESELQLCTDSVGDYYQSLSWLRKQAIFLLQVASAEHFCTLRDFGLTSCASNSCQQT